MMTCILPLHCLMLGAPNPPIAYYSGMIHALSDFVVELLAPQCFHATKRMISGLYDHQQAHYSSSSLALLPMVMVQFDLGENHR